MEHDEPLRDDGRQQYTDSDVHSFVAEAILDRCACSRKSTRSIPARHTAASGSSTTRER